MYLEERVEQLEALAVDQSKQSELIAKAVAKLTIDTQQGLDKLRKGQIELQQEVTRLADSIEDTNERVSQLDRKMDQRFEEVGRKMDQRFEEVDRKMDQRFEEVDRKMDQRFAEVNDRFAQVDAKQDEMRQDINGMRQDIVELKVGQELILQILREKLT